MESLFGFLTALVTSGASIIGLVVIGAIILIGLKIVRSGRDGRLQEDETRMIQEMYQGLARMEKRLDALETIVCDRDKGGGL